MLKEVITWEPQFAVLRDLLLLALHRQDGSIQSQPGHITMRLEELCGIPDSKRHRSYISATLRKMEDATLIVRTRPGNGKYITAVALAVSLSDTEIRELETAEQANLASFGVARVNTTEVGSSDRITLLVGIIEKLEAEIKRLQEELSRHTASAACADEVISRYREN